MEISTTKTQAQRTTDEKLEEDVLSATLRQSVRSRSRPTGTRNVLATRDVSARGHDADPQAARMTSATLPHSPTATNLGGVGTSSDPVLARGV
jgi:hypothetical protein